MDPTRTLRSRWLRFGRDPCNVSRVASPNFFLPARMDKAKPQGVCMRGSFFRASLFLFSFAKVADEIPQATCGEHNASKPCRPAAAVRNTMYVHVACPRYIATRCFCRGLSFVTLPYRTFLLRCRCVRVLIDRVTLGGIIGTIGIVI